MRRVTFEWTGSEMVPLPRFDNICKSQFVQHELYTMEPAEDISDAERGFYFSCVATAWKQLPDDLASKYPDADSLRKRALIKCGYVKEHFKTFKNEVDAHAAAALAQPLDEFAVIVVKDCTVHVLTPETQSAKVMGKDRWRESKDRVLDLLSKLIGVDVTTLKANAPGPREYRPEDQT